MVSCPVRFASHDGRMYLYRYLSIHPILRGACKQASLFYCMFKTVGQRKRWFAFLIWVPRFWSPPVHDYPPSKTDEGFAHGEWLCASRQNNAAKAGIQNHHQFIWSPQESRTGEALTHTVREVLSMFQDQKNRSSGISAEQTEECFFNDDKNYGDKYGRIL